jgi:hypothetical protein
MLLSLRFGKKLPLIHMLLLSTLGKNGKTPQRQKLDGSSGSGRPPPSFIMYKLKIPLISP